MELAPGWTTIVGCPVGGRDVVLFYDDETGNAETAYIDSKGIGIPLKAFTLRPGWSNIAFCNRRLLFFNESNGVAAIGTIGRDGEFKNNAVLTSLKVGDERSELPTVPEVAIGPGRADILSDGHHFLVIRPDVWRVCTLTTQRSGGEVYPWQPDPEGEFSSHYKIKIVSQYHQFRSEFFDIQVAGSDVMAFYSVDYRIAASIFYIWINAAGEIQGKFAPRHADPNWSTIVLSNGYLMYYDEGVGGGKIVAPSEDDLWFEDSRWTVAAISPLWSHIIPVGARLLFYAQYNGDARVGHITPNGEFSGETKL